MPNTVVRWEARKGAMWITLNRPDAMNALTPEVLRGIDSALDEVETRSDLMAVVLTGSGRAFCAGVDLKYVRQKATQGSSVLNDFLDGVRHTMSRLERFPKPVIAAINGLALAGGLELVLCCDLVIAARSARIGDAHATYGLLPGCGASVRLPRKIGPTRAKYLFYTAELSSADELVAAGLVNLAVDDDQLLFAAEKLVSKIVSKSSSGLRQMKALIDDGLQLPMEMALQNERLALDVQLA